MSLAFYSHWFGLEGQAAVVVGGSGALGGAVAEGLARAGATIVVAGRNESRGHGCVERIRSCGGSAGFRRVDLAAAGAAHRLLDFALGEHGAVDILVNAVSPRWDADWAPALCDVFAAAMSGQADGGAILNLVPEGGPAREAAASAMRRLARKDGNVRVNGIRVPPAADPESLCGVAVALLSRRAGAWFQAGELPALGD